MEQTFQQRKKLIQVERRIMKNKLKLTSSKKAFRLPKISLRKNVSVPNTKSILKAERKDNSFYHE